MQQRPAEPIFDAQPPQPLLCSRERPARRPYNFSARVPVPLPTPPWPCTATRPPPPPKININTPEPQRTAGQLLDELCSGGGGGGGSLPFAQLQCVLAVGCYSHCLRALLPALQPGAAAAAAGKAAMELMQQPLSKLLAQVGRR